MSPRRTYRVKQVAAISGVSVRALHHYDALGLLVPSMRSAAGYRLYSDDDLLRLQQVVIGRELGLALEEIRRMLDDPAYDRRAALVAQRAELSRRVEAARAMIGAVDAALAVLDGGVGEAVTEGLEVDMKRIFDGFDPQAYAEEAHERWGRTEAYRVSMERAKSYTEDDWRRLRAEQDSIYGEAFALLQAGKRPDDADAMAVAERHRLSIERWFYPCTRQMHRGLADLYEADARFAENIDKYGEGLTPFLVAAIRANAARAAA
jgi:DNA-binding transcriptional MerR regulator